MTDRVTPRFFEDTFGRDDSADVGGSWANNGTLQIVNQAVRQSGVSATATAHLTMEVGTAASDCGNAYEVSMKVACASDSTTARLATSLLRYQGDPDTGMGYGVSLEWREVASEERLTLKIRKCMSGIWTDLAEEVVTTVARVDTGGSYDGVFQDLGAKIYNVDGDVVIEAMLNDRAAPRLTYTDKEYPLLTAPGVFGLLAEDNNAGVDGYIILSAIALQSLQQEEATVGPVVYKWSFGEIKRQVRTHARRDSQDTLDDQYFADIVNESLQEFALHHLPAHWWEEQITLNMKAEQDEVVLPPNIVLHDDYAYDQTNRSPIPIVRVRDYESFPGQPSGQVTGSVQSFLATGRGHGGGITLQPRPYPAAATSVTLRVWRQPTIMVSDDQIPDLPEPLIPGLIWGAVYLYALRDSDRTHIMSAGRQKEMWYESARRLRNRFYGLSAPQYAKSGFRIGSAINRWTGRFGRV